MSRLNGKKTEPSVSKSNGRAKDGTFAPGNPGGPGRPRRDTERSYLATISEACPPAVWREIVAKAVEYAKAGDPKAREWLASYLVGRPESASPTLHQLAVTEASGRDPVDSEASLDALVGLWPLTSPDAT